MDFLTSKIKYLNVILLIHIVKHNNKLILVLNNFKNVAATAIHSFKWVTITEILV